MSTLCIYAWVSSARSLRRARPSHASMPARKFADSQYLMTEPEACARWRRARRMMLHTPKTVNYICVFKLGRSAFWYLVVLAEVGVA